MTKSDIVAAVAAATEQGKKGAEQAVDAVLTSISQALAKGDKVDLRGFGRFQVNQKKERQGRNPKTGETITIGAKRVAVFKSSKELSEHVNQSQVEAGQASGQ